MAAASRLGRPHIAGCEIWSTDTMPVDNSEASEAAQRKGFVTGYNYVGTGQGTRPACGEGLLRAFLSPWERPLKAAVQPHSAAMSGTSGCSAATSSRFFDSLFILSRKVWNET